MIAMLTGTLSHRGPSSAILSVNGVGYRIHATSRDLDDWVTKPEALTVMVSTQVREDSITLYAFNDSATCDLFGTLIGTSGVGPKLAVAVLNALSPADLAAAVEAGDIATLTRISGVGKKTAQRLALELKGKIGGDWQGVVSASISAIPVQTDPLMFALDKLGYTRSETMRTLRNLEAAGLGPEKPIAERLRAALASMG
jgi:Holliday junction DNA helicase RuvA